jgi:hypothetical protein
MWEETVMFLTWMLISEKETAWKMLNGLTFDRLL